ncbi:MAG: GNAT family N-acetyltransferase [Clostridia bacterium]|nr:GNAT family N-acetyltransferase [Clostridia bacterium]
MSDKKRQLLMRRDMNKPLVELPPLPELYEIKTDDGTYAGAWEWITAGAFPDWQPKYSMILNDPRCAPERVFFVNEYSQPSATASVQMEEKRALVHMVATHPYAAGMGFGKYAVDACLKYMRAHGVKTAELTTDDFRLSAIKMYLELGFDPVIDDEEMELRWKAVMENLASFKGSKKPEIIPLWPDGNIPYFIEGNCIPSIEAYPAEGSKGAVVICPGGAYRIKASHEGRQIARMLNDAGISAYVLDYRVRPCHYEAPLSDAKRAIRTVRAMGYEKVGVMGFSAGGHLTCSAATLYDAGDAAAEDPIERISSRPDAFIPCYPVASFASFRHQGSLELLLGDQKNNYALIKRFSSELNVTGDTPPAFIWHTMTDAAVPVENSVNLASALAHAGIRFELHIFPDGPHGLGLAGGNPVIGKWPGLCQRWLTELGFGR